MLAGYGEPMMHKNFNDLVQTFSKVCNVETTINGDFLTVKIIISLYDGIEQIERFNNMFKKAGVGEDKYILRDRWYSEDNDFGVKLTNRTGVLNFGNQPKIDKNKPCYYPHYSMIIDWNADCYLCTQDWSRRIKTGNIMFSSFLEIWTSSILKKYRNHLANGKRDLYPCLNCNANGTLHGFNHKNIWKNIIK